MSPAVSAARAKNLVGWVGDVFGGDDKASRARELGAADRQAATLQVDFEERLSALTQWEVRGRREAADACCAKLMRLPPGGCSLPLKALAAPARGRRASGRRVWVAVAAYTFSRPTKVHHAVLGAKVIKLDVCKSPWRLPVVREEQAAPKHSAALKAEMREAVVASDAPRAAYAAASRASRASA